MAAKGREKYPDRKMGGSRIDAILYSVFIVIFLVAMLYYWNTSPLTSLLMIILIVIMAIYLYRNRRFRIRWDGQYIYLRYGFFRAEEKYPIESIERFETDARNVVMCIEGKKIHCLTSQKDSARLQQFWRVRMREIRAQVENKDDVIPPENEE